MRRSILRTLVGGEATVETIQSKTGIDPQSVIWHLNILEYGSCVEKERKDGTLLYRLTKEGTVVGYVDK